MVFSMSDNATAVLADLLIRLLRLYSRYIYKDVAVLYCSPDQLSDPYTTY